jgi:hypothetical protein
MNAEYIACCHQCYFRMDPGESGGCECGISSADITEHAKSGTCPMGQFDRQPSLRIKRSPIAKTKRYIALIRQAIDLLPPLPADPVAGRGVVICGGGNIPSPIPKYMLDHEDSRG